MDLALMIARSGMDAHHKNIEVIANNLANANTTGFKKDRAEFADLPYQVMKQPGSPTTQDINSAGGVVVGTGTKLTNNKKMFIDGPQNNTNGALDIAIRGRGFFQVQLPNGSEFGYTRFGSLQLNEQGQLTLPNGYLIQPPITIPPGTTQIDISEDEILSIVSPGSTTATQVGQLQLADFLNPEGLQPIGDNLYLATTGSGTATLGNPGQTGLGSMVQGALEGSNVNVVEEMVNMIEAQRAFEVTSKAASTVDSMLQYLEQIT